MAEITTFITYDHEAEQAVQKYVSIFEGTITSTTRAGGPDSPVFSLTFEILGKSFIAMNGGPSFGFAQGISLFVACDTQDEIDRYYLALLEGGGKEIQCGWLTDRFGVCWQIVPKTLGKYLGGPDRDGAERAMQAMMQMKKLDIAALARAYTGS